MEIVVKTATISIILTVHLHCPEVARRAGSVELDSCQHKLQVVSESRPCGTF